MNKHTPGPWKVRTAYSNGEPVCYTIHLGQTSIADVTSLSEQDRVNATLIAAAPAMYQSGTLTVDIMERVAKELERKGLEKLRSLLRSAIMEQKQALAQAEGKP